LQFRRSSSARPCCFTGSPARPAGGAASRKPVAVHLAPDDRAADFCVIASVVDRGGRLQSHRRRRGGLGLHHLHPASKSAARSSGARVTGDRVSSKQHRLPAEQAILSSTARRRRSANCKAACSSHHGPVVHGMEPDLKRCHYLILDMRRVQSVDFTAAHLLELSRRFSKSVRVFSSSAGAREPADGAGSPGPISRRWAS